MTKVIKSLQEQFPNLKIVNTIKLISPISFVDDPIVF
jgi:hypothetical protein